MLGALPPALARLGHRVTLVVPRYRGVRDQRVGASPFRCRSAAPRRDAASSSSRWPTARAWSSSIGPICTTATRSTAPAAATIRTTRGASPFSARAALEYALHARARRPFDRVHAHDWQAGLAPVYLRTLYADSPLGIDGVGVHDPQPGVSGIVSAGLAARRSIWGRSCSRIDGLEFWGQISFLKGGINYADVITTVSPRYAKEIQTPEFGFGFDGILRRARRDLVGILNGIDTDRWDPARDPFLPAPYDAHEPRKEGGVKARAARACSALTRTSGRLERPLVGMISRMVDQKGFDLIAALADELPTLRTRFAVLGTGDARYQELWLDLARDVSGPHRRADRLRRAAGAPDRRRARTSS